MTVYTYVVAQDYGFAPKPFHGACTLATCKPGIRERANVGDYIIGVGCAKRRRSGHLVYFMHVDDLTTYCKYWNDPRFRSKRPNLHGSKMQAFGDNIYHRDSRTRTWRQANSHHSLRNGRPNPLNVEHDTKSSNVLISFDFAFWGGEGPVIPNRFRYADGSDLFMGRGYRLVPDRIATRLIAWFRALNQRGYVGAPLDWVRSA